MDGLAADARGRGNDLGAGRRREGRGTGGGRAAGPPGGGAAVPVAV